MKLLARLDNPPLKLLARLDRLTPVPSSSQDGGGSARPKIIDRVLAAVLTPGTLTGDFVTGDQATYVMALREDRATHEFGVCFADTGAACLFFSSVAWLLSRSCSLHFA